MEEDKISLLMKSWAIDVDVLNKDSQKARWNNFLHNDNNKNSAAYLPYTISFGPYHHEKGDHLKKMDLHKHRVLGHFLRRYNITLQELADSLTSHHHQLQMATALPIHVLKEVLPVLKHLMDSYDSLDDKWLHDHDEFLKLMILDGCFMLEILQWSSVSDNHKAALSSGSVPAAATASTFSLMLGNQLPMLLLKTLLGAVLPTERKEDIEEHLNPIILNFCRGNLSYTKQNMGPCLHVLDLYRKSLLSSNLPEDPPTGFPSSLKDKNVGDHSKAKGPTTTFGHTMITDQKNSTAGGGKDIIRSAMNLHESGIKFEKSTESCNLTDIWFKGHMLKLPVVVIDDTTESTYTSDVCFMDNNIDSSNDVKVLRSSGVLHNAIGNITPDPESRLEKIVQKQLDEYCRSKWHEWRANLSHTYFKNPWALLSLLAASFSWFSPYLRHSIPFILTTSQGRNSTCCTLPPPYPPMYYCNFSLCLLFVDVIYHLLAFGQDLKHVKHVCRCHYRHRRGFFFFCQKEKKRFKTCRRARREIYPTIANNIPTLPQGPQLTRFILSLVLL
ncbi:hypothetical protein MKX01_000246 [Papaver californicum]|nr:hypothetical protein MKX01_000246 [Papaver californicum]